MEELLRAQEEGPQPKGDRELLDQVREANERLVLATLHAQAMTEAAEQANQLKDEFLAIVSHELRTLKGAETLICLLLVISTAINRTCA